jgi:hypothetical protein
MPAPVIRLCRPPSDQIIWFIQQQMVSAVQGKPPHSEWFGSPYGHLACRLQGLVLTWPTRQCSHTALLRQSPAELSCNQRQHSGLIGLKEGLQRHGCCSEGSRAGLDSRGAQCILASLTLQSTVSHVRTEAIISALCFGIVILRLYPATRLDLVQIIKCSRKAQNRLQDLRSYSKEPRQYSGLRRPKSRRQGYA